LKTGSIKFRLLFWYAAMLVGGFAFLGVVTYLVLENSLVSALKESQWRRARQISQLLSEELKAGREASVGEQVEARYAPALNERFVRISQRDGVTLYLSSAPSDHTFDPATLPPPAWPSTEESSSQVSMLGGRKMLVTSHRLTMPGGKDYLVEAGAPMDAVQADLRKWLWFLAALLPLVLVIALGGGSVLVKRALLPVARIAGSAEHISSHNLSERLPVPQTGDELERLSVALNHMIERLDAAFQHSRQFVADASHELRTPLTALRGELESLAEEPEMNTAWRERLGSALEELERLTRIVEGLFAISRLDAGEAATEWLPLDLAQLASSTAEQMSLLAEDKNIHVTCEGALGVWVAGDRARLKQVVVNLLDNAIKYTPEGGSVSMTVGAHERKAVLEVTDTGLGIPADALPRVFERFFRVDKARARAQGGAGLGLAIVKSICAAHYGRVDVTSSPGGGSRFRVELPLVGAPQSNQQRNGHNEH
jgi:heavy metal sensor kinase